MAAVWIFRLPYRRLDLRSELSPSEAAQVLANTVEPRRWFRFFWSRSRVFEGAVTGFTFDIQRIIGYRNSFLPRISGTIAADGRGSTISITMKLHPVVQLFMVFWLGFVAIAVLVVAVAALRGSAPIATILGPAAMFLFGWLMTVGGFSGEASKAQGILEGILKATPSDPPRLRGVSPHFR